MPTQVAACLHFARRARLLIALALLPAGFAHAAPETSLTLGDATLRTMQRNPELQVFRWRFQALDGQRYTADQAPAWSVGLDSENVLGSGDYSKFDSAEFTLSLSSVIELGGKRGQRLAVADSNYALAEAEQRAQALDLLGRVTQDFITTLVLQEKLKIASEAVRLAEENQRLVLQRVRQGAAPEAESLRAKAALSNAKMEQEALSAEYSSRKMVLATAWGGKAPTLRNSVAICSSSMRFPTLRVCISGLPPVRRLRSMPVRRACARPSCNWRKASQSPTWVGKLAYVVSRM